MMSLRFSRFDDELVALVLYRYSFVREHIALQVFQQSLKQTQVLITNVSSDV